MLLLSDFENNMSFRANVSILQVLLNDYQVVDKNLHGNLLRLLPRTEEETYKQVNSILTYGNGEVVAHYSSYQSEFLFNQIDKEISGSKNSLLSVITLGQNLTLEVIVKPQKLQVPHAVIVGNCLMYL